MIYTVKDLLDACSEQVSKGNGNKKIYISYIPFSTLIT